MQSLKHLQQRVPHSTRAGLAAALLVLPMLSACGVLPFRSSRASSVPRLARTIAETVTSEALAPGVTLHRLVHNAEPWRAAVLEVDRTACVSLQAVKGGPVAVGRSTTSTLLAGMSPALKPIAAVNADFFLFAPPGVPVGAHIENGALISGPIDRPVFAVTDDGRPWIGALSVKAQMRTPRGTTADIVNVDTWNRPTANRVGVVDAAWGVPIDSSLIRRTLVLEPVAAPATRTQRFVLKPLRGPTAIARGDTLLVVNLPKNSAIVLGDTISLSRELMPITPVQSVGAQPVLLRDSAIVGAVDSVNNAAFRGLNPRTAVGYGDGGRRIFIAVIDGRQPKYSMGMSLRQTAELFRAIGATNAVNLDGGGSSAMVVTDAKAPRGVRTVTHPSDGAGERPVANALAVLRSCRK